MGEPGPEVMAPHEAPVVGLLQDAVDAVSVRVTVDRLGHEHTLPATGAPVNRADARSASSSVPGTVVGDTCRPSGLDAAMRVGRLG